MTVTETRRRPRMYTRWRCPICRWEYRSPIPASVVFHRCPARGGARRFLKGVERAS